MSTDHQAPLVGLSLEQHEHIYGERDRLHLEIAWQRHQMEHVASCLETLKGLGGPDDALTSLQELLRSTPPELKKWSLELTGSSVAP